jgi:hypothetical protein
VIIYINSINQMIFVMEMQYVFCEVGNECINAIKLISNFKSQGSEGSQSHQTAKFGHEFCGTWNQESVCWQGPAAI